MARTLNLDDELGLTDETPLHTRPIHVFGLEIRVVCDVNNFAMLSAMGSGDAGSSMQFVESMIHPDDWQAFRSAAASAPALRGEGGTEKMKLLINRIMEVAAEPFPTKPPSASQRGPSTPSSARKLPANSASARANRGKTSR